MITIAEAVDEARMLVALYLIKAELESLDVRDLNVVRGAMLFYRAQRCARIETINLPQPFCTEDSMLTRSELLLVALASRADNTLPQRKMLRGCLDRVRAVLKRRERILEASIPFDWRAAQLPAGDRP